MNNINYETIISSFDDKGTLLKWLKTIDAELKGAKITSSSWRVVEGEESNTAYLTLTTSDGVNFETEGLVIPKVTSAIIIDVINQAIAIYCEDYSGSQTLQEFVNYVENELDVHASRLDALENSAPLYKYSGQITVDNGIIYFDNIITSTKFPNQQDTAENVIYKTKFETNISFMDNGDKLHAGILFNTTGQPNNLQGLFETEQAIEFSSGNGYEIYRQNLKTGEIELFQE